MTTVGVVTGGTRGMGLACARRLPELVDVVVVVSRSEADTAETAARLTADGITAEPFAADVTDVDALARLAERVAELGELRAVAHAAGISPNSSDWRRVMEVDYVGTARLLDALRPLTVAGTATVCFSSMARHFGPPPSPETLSVLDDALAPDFLDRLREAGGPAIEDAGYTYALSKVAVCRLVQQEAVRLGPIGARVCSVSPGLIDTSFVDAEQERSTIQEMVRRTPLGRRGTPEDVAGITMFLLSDQAAFISGADVLVDGGVIAALHSPVPAA